MIEFVDGDPAEGGAAEVLRVVSFPGAADEFEDDGFVGILVADCFKFFSDSYLDGEFFVEFAVEAGGESFAWFTFAAGEFPEAALVSVGVAPGNEEFTVFEDEAGGDFNGLHIWKKGVQAFCAWLQVVANK